MTEENARKEAKKKITDALQKISEGARELVAAEQAYDEYLSRKQNGNKTINTN